MRTQQIPKHRFYTCTVSRFLCESNPAWHISPNLVENTNPTKTNHNITAIYVSDFCVLVALLCHSPMTSQQVRRVLEHLGGAYMTELWTRWHGGRAQRQYKQQNESGGPKKGNARSYKSLLCICWCWVWGCIWFELRVELCCRLRLRF